ncbi:hypothetical protein [Bradyrhizobium zhanjiangense]|uniref:hypothetical protein n=1 Tax=Bradyrhizobium zhanjiangense TaxID=1325107 RepID=UPI00100927AF|nr:hypothetical protein [Bradyrhizobium zhanjiangense]
MQDRTENRIFASRREMICGLMATTLPFSRSAAAQEPVTLGSAAAFVGLALLQGAISYVGGRLLASALGDPVISDVQSWLKNAIAELEAFVSAELRRQLDERVIEQMSRGLAGHQHQSLSVFEPAGEQSIA